jgi:glycosyltransferase involved in cell wall biosynthesis
MSSVDIVVPCYNYGRFLHRCVNSVLSQEHVDVRVLIIDDASPDDTPEIGRRLAALDPRVDFVRHHANQGHIATYNEGLLGWASGEYSLLLSADDMLAPRSLARAVEVMNRHKDVGMTYGMALIVGDDEMPNEAPKSGSEDYQIVSGEKFLERCCQSGNPVPTPTSVVRTKLQQKLGGYRAEFPHSGDLEMWMRFAVHSSVGVVRAVQAYYRWHSGNMSCQYYTQRLSDRREVVKTCRHVFDTWGELYPKFGVWWESMCQRYGEDAFWRASEAFDEGDIEACKSYLEFAEEIRPGIRHSGMWWRLRAKRFAGKSLWQKLSPVLNWVRGGDESSLGMTVGLLSRFRPGNQIGWWPGAS